MLTTTDVQGSTVALSRSDGTLRITNLMSGTYRIVAVPGPWAYSPTSVLLDGREVLGQVVGLAVASPPLHVVYAANTGVVHGTVERRVRTVVLRPIPFVPPVAARAQPCNDRGTFEIDRVPAGRYYALAFDHVDPTAPPDEASCRARS